jgi:hypothetical protein
MEYLKKRTNKIMMKGRVWKRHSRSIRYKRRGTEGEAEVEG